MPELERDEKPRPAGSIYIPPHTSALVKLVVRPDRPVTHKASGFEHLQVLRDGRSADRQLTGQLADRQRTVGKALHDRSPGAVGQGYPSIMSLVSDHER